MAVPQTDNVGNFDSYVAGFICKSLIEYEEQTAVKLCRVKWATQTYEAIKGVLRLASDTSVGVELFFSQGRRFSP